MSLILVVDDTALERETVARLLEVEGFQTIGASSGKEAYATLYSRKPDLVLLDLMMPEMDGIQLLRMIRRHPQWEQIPIIVLTGPRDSNKLVARARELGVEAIVSKATFGFEDLMIRIRKALANRTLGPN
ncbi:MAG: response regulator [Tepidisphaeraceae bacterium]|jgi:CheY-like chemotaxis protein